MVVDCNSSSDELDNSFDVIVVGSGAGGAACAYEFTKAGYSVALLEEGALNKTEEFSLSVAKQIRTLYRNGGASMIMGKPQISYAEGRTVGGSTVVHGSMAWRTPGRILWRWRREFGLSSFTDKYLDPIFKDVETMTGATRVPAKHVGRDCAKLREGASKLGYRHEFNKRSAHGCVATNLCAFGCPTGAKGSVLVNYIPQALQKGLTLFTNFTVRKLHRDKDRIVAVSGYSSGQPHRKLKIHGSIVVLACGSVSTAGLLLRNRLQTGSKMVGKNLSVHPNAKALGIYPEKIEGWKGTIQAIKITEWFDQKILFATSFVPPSLLSMSMPLWGNQAYDFFKEYLTHGVAAGLLIEDSNRGQVRPTPFGLNTPFYQVNDEDVYNILKGLAIISEIHFAAGATKVLLPIHGLPEVTSMDEVNKIFSQNIKAKQIELFTVHMMGTAHMSSNERQSATDEYGKVWGLKNLYVSDASLFPTPITVNPQITIMSLATHVARSIIERRSDLNGR